MWGRDKWAKLSIQLFSVQLKSCFSVLQNRKMPKLKQKKTQLECRRKKVALHFELRLPRQNMNSHSSVNDVFDDDVKLKERIAREPGRENVRTSGSGNIAVKKFEPGKEKSLKTEMI